MARISLQHIEEGEVLVLYKKGSRGEIIGIYNSIKELGDLERKKYNGFNDVQIYHILIGRSKSYASFHHQCRAVVRIKTLEEVREKLQQEAA